MGAMGSPGLFLTFDSICVLGLCTEACRSELGSHAPQNPINVFIWGKFHQLKDTLDSFLVFSVNSSGGGHWGWR